MKRIALLNSSGLCLSVALWDGLSAWNPVAAGLCASTVDVTARPDVGPGWSDSAGTWTAPAPPAPTPDPHAFVTAVAADGALAPATRIAAVNVLYSLTSALDAGNEALIPGIWALLIAQYAISTADQSAVHALALQYAIPGI